MLSLRPAGPQARSEVRSTASRAAVRGLVAPDEVGGPLWVERWPRAGGRLCLWRGEVGTCRLSEQIHYAIGQ